MKNDAAHAVLSALAEAEMFPGLAYEDLDFLTKQGQLRAFRAGSRLIRQGDVSRYVHIIMEGCVRVERFHPDVADPVVLADLGPGEVVVGVEVLGGQLRLTSVTAIEDTETLQLDVRALAQAVLKYPDLSVALLHGLSHHTPNANRETSSSVTRSAIASGYQNGLLAAGTNVTEPQPALLDHRAVDDDATEGHQAGDNRSSQSGTVDAARVDDAVGRRPQPRLDGDATMRPTDSGREQTFESSGGERR